jgi:hypothetical protein
MRLSKEKGRQPVTICATIKRDNEEQRAILVTSCNDMIDHWLPRSQILRRVKNDDGTEAIVIRMWLAVEKGIEFDEELPEEEIPF